MYDVMIHHTLTSIFKVVPYKVDIVIIVLP